MSPLQSFVSFLSISQSDLEGGDIDQGYINDSNVAKATSRPFDHASFFSASMGLESISGHDYDYDCAVDDDEFEEDLFEPLHRCNAEQPQHHNSLVNDRAIAPSTADLGSFKKDSISNLSSISSAMYSSGSDSGHESSGSSSRRSTRRALKRFATSLSFLSRHSDNNKSIATQYEYDGSVVATTVSAPAELAAPPSRISSTSITTKKLWSRQPRGGRESEGKQHSMPDLTTRRHVLGAWGSYGTIPL